MSISTIMVGIRFLFGGRGAVIDYATGKLNEFMGQGDVSSKVKEGYELSMKVLYYLQKYASWCPKKWEKEYSLLITTVSTLTGVFQDTRVTHEEVEACIAQFQKAYAEWISED